MAGTALLCDVSGPSEIQIIAALNTAYVIFPTVEAAKKVLYGLEGRAIFKGEISKADFYQMNLVKPKTNTLDSSLLQNWVCDKCDYKNYAKRNRCHKCENPKNSNCKVVYNTPVFMKNQNANAHMVSRSFQETQLNKMACEALLVRGESLKGMTPEGVARCSYSAF